MDEKIVLNPMQFGLRVAYIVVTAMIALAFIVITFVADTWASIPSEKQHFAFVVINASGAHFICSLAYGAACIFVCRIFPYWKVSASLAVGGATYIYCALILQHRGLADSLLSQPWVSIFPFGQAMIGLVRGPHLEAFFYFTPLAAACAMTTALLTLLLVGDRLISSKKVPRKPGARSSRSPRPKPRH